MKYMKMLGLFAFVTAALVAFVGTASATVTSPPGTVFTGTIKTTSTNASLHGSVSVSCTHSQLDAEVKKVGSTNAIIRNLTFTGCGFDTVKPFCYIEVTNLKTDCGLLTVNSAGTVTSMGIEVTVQLHRTVLGFPVTTHCIYKTFATDVGTLTEWTAPSTFHIGSSPIPEVATDGACGNDAVWTGSYAVSSPISAIDVD